MNNIGRTYFYWLYVSKWLRILFQIAIQHKGSFFQFSSFSKQKNVWDFEMDLLFVAR